MSIRVAVPVIRARMKVIVNKGIHWNPADWILLWALTKNRQLHHHSLSKLICRDALLSR